jgi:4-nitrophenyl phosphatase
MLWLIDLDGVMWRYTTLIAGSDKAIEIIRNNGDRAIFVTNNSTLTRTQYMDKLRRFNIGIEREDIVTSGMALARLLQNGERVLGIGEEGLLEEIRQRDVELVVPKSYEDATRANVVALGWHRKFSYLDMANACVAVRNGARFLATNRDRTYPLEDFVVPGTGSLVASVEACTDVEPVFAGKPDDAMVALVSESIDRDSTIMAGDRLSTDGLFAKKLGVQFGWVSSGIREERDSTVPVTLEADDLLALVYKFYGS